MNIHAKEECTYQSPALIVNLRSAFSTSAVRRLTAARLFSTSADSESELNKVDRSGPILAPDSVVTSPELELETNRDIEAKYGAVDMG